LETAHPAKFVEDVEGILGRQITIPDNLLALKGKEKRSIQMSKEYEGFKDWLLNRK